MVVFGIYDTVRKWRNMIMMKREAFVKWVGIIIKIGLLVLLVVQFQGILETVQERTLTASWGSLDFQWDSAKLYADRINPYVESLEGYRQYNGAYDDFFGPMETNQFPSLLVVLLPLTMFEPMEAICIWYFCNLLFTVLIGILLKMTFLRKLDWLTCGILTLLMACSYPWRVCVGNGQHTLFAIFFFLLAVKIADRWPKKAWGQIAAGFCLAVCFFKYTSTLPMALFFLYKKWYKPIGISMIVHGGLTIFSAFWLRASLLDMIVLPLRISSKLSGQGFADLQTLLPSKIIYMAVLLVFGCMLLYIVFCKRAEHDSIYSKTWDENSVYIRDLEIISLLTIVSLLAVYHRQYDYFVMVLPLGYFCCRFWGDIKGRDWVMSIVDILSAGIIWLIFMSDTVIVKFGISFSGSEAEEIRYQWICRAGMYFMLLYFLAKAWGISRKNKDKMEEI